MAQTIKPAETAINQPIRNKKLPLARYRGTGLAEPQTLHQLLKVKYSSTDKKWLKMLII